ncbi:hypothetical protein J7E63_17425 [Bacillus sp. ISL-75]|uniref:hypothetical protein n=1 Tax=Bacillus sp. ISL-75 TaxID=2819137 RepID=UPI001BE6E4F5|nr:hypothetical protein [Bacillus sp. ISL-75]MBT2728698.1 hypothetical protein [Bacillus sp. ISL-75]
MNLSIYVVEDAAYQAWLLRLAFPQALPASLAHEILRFYSGLSPAQLGQVLKHSDPTPVFTELFPEQLAVTYLSADVGYTQPEQVAQALYVSGVFPKMRTALDVAEVIYSPTVFPTLEKESMRPALKAANMPEDGINEAISKLYSSVELNPPETSPGLHPTKNESSFRFDHVIVSNGRSVAFRFPLNDDQMRNGHTIAAFTGLVSRNRNQEGFPPISLRINKQLVTIAGAGFNPHRVEFFLPASWLNGKNVMELQAAPDLRTLFWLYRMEVVHYKYS